MKFVFKLNACNLLICTCFLVGCSATTASLTNNLANKSEMNIAPLPLDQYPSQHDERKFVKEGGWQVPLLDDTKKTKTIFYSAASYNGDTVEVASTKKSILNK